MQDYWFVWLCGRAALPGLAPQVRHTIVSGYAVPKLSLGTVSNPCRFMILIQAISSNTSIFSTSIMSLIPPFFHPLFCCFASCSQRKGFFLLEWEEEDWGKKSHDKSQIQLLCCRKHCHAKKYRATEKIYILGLEDCIRFLQRNTHFLFCYLCVIVRCQHGFNHTWICVEYEWKCFFFKQKGRIDSNSVKKLVWCTDAVLHFPDRGIKWLQLCCSFFISAEWVLSPIPCLLLSICLSTSPPLHSLPIPLS